jgi:hypothetical protein
MANQWLSSKHLKGTRVPLKIEEETVEAETVLIKTLKKMDGKAGRNI